MTPVSKWIRLLNFIIDGIIIRYILCQGLIYRFLLDKFPDSFAGVHEYNLTIIGILMFVFYYFLFELITGRTLAKIMTSSVVVRIDGNKLNAWDIFLRTLCRCVPFDVFSFLWGKGWHDSVADVMVVANEAFELKEINDSKIDYNPKIEVEKIEALDIEPVAIKPIITETAPLPLSPIVRSSKFNIPKFKIHKYVWFSLAGLILLLMLTNPSVTAFKDYLGVRTSVGIQRRYNFFICSYYTYDHNYFGIAGNFFEIKHAAWTPPPTDSLVNDTTQKADTSMAKMADTSKAQNQTDSTNLPPSQPKYDLIYDTVGNSRETLYQKLKDAGYTEKSIGTEVAFVKGVQHKKVANILFDDLIKAGYTERQIGSKDLFVFYMTNRN